jgi:hypothetical protein
MGFASVVALGAPPSFRVSQIYSNLDGSIQYITLTETQGLNGQHHFTGLTLTATHEGVTKQFIFPADLSTDQTANLSIVVATGTWAEWEAWCCFLPGVAIPARFLPTDGGSINFAGVDELSYASVPTDGENGLNRDLTVGRAIVPQRDYRTGMLQTAPFPMPITTVGMVEYYNASLDHYFYTASAPDVDALDSGRLKGWQRTGNGFAVTASAKPVATGAILASPVCRYYMPPSSGDSHFFSASKDECDEVRARFPDFVLESEAAFFVALPDTDSGVCPRSTDIDYYGLLFPVFRLWNHRLDSNHRYTGDSHVRDAMVAQGYIAEGYGPDAVAFCVQGVFGPWDYAAR